jgi:hypothetical protein
MLCGLGIEPGRGPGPRTALRGDREQLHRSLGRLHCTRAGRMHPAGRRRLRLTRLTASLGRTCPSDAHPGYRAEPVLGHRRRLPVRVPDHRGRRSAVRRTAEHRPQHKAGRRRDRRRQRRTQHGDAPHLLTSPRRPRRRGLAVQRGCGPHRARGDPAERAELAWHGPNHSPDNIYIHFPATTP